MYIQNILIFFFCQKYDINLFLLFLKLTDHGQMTLGMIFYCNSRRK